MSDGLGRIINTTDTQSGLAVKLKLDYKGIKDDHVIMFLRWDGTVKDVRDPQCPQLILGWTPVSGFTDEELDYLESQSVITTVPISFSGIK